MRKKEGGRNESGEGEGEGEGEGDGEGYIRRRNNPRLATAHYMVYQCRPVPSPSYSGRPPGPVTHLCRHEEEKNLGHAGEDAYGVDGEAQLASREGRQASAGDDFPPHAVELLPKGVGGRRRGPGGKVGGWVL